MSRKCTICNHSKRSLIDRELLTDKSIVELSQEYGVLESALRNHKKNHLSRQILRATELMQDRESIDLLATADDSIKQLQTIILESIANGWNQVTINAIAVSIKAVESNAKLKFAAAQIAGESNQAAETRKNQLAMKLLCWEDLKEWSRLAELHYKLKQDIPDYVNEQEEQRLITLLEDTCKQAEAEGNDE